METISLQTSDVSLVGDLTVRPDSEGLVIFAHGSGSSRHSSRNQYVASVLIRHGLATLLLDLLTDEEEVIDRRTTAYRFDVDLLAGRLEGATRWAVREPKTSRLGIGYFGASTGAAAALIAASRQAQTVQAIVSRGGRPDLAGATALQSVRAPTLFIVGGNDTEVLGLNQRAAACLAAPHELQVVEGASHLFEERGALAEVSSLAGKWFSRYLKRTDRTDAAREDIESNARG